MILLTIVGVALLLVLIVVLMIDTAIHNYGMNKWRAELNKARAERIAAEDLGITVSQLRRQRIEPRLFEEKDDVG